MYVIVSIAEMALVCATLIGGVIQNARLVTRLRRDHHALYESIGSPGWLWNWPRSRNSVMDFVFGSGCANLNDSVLANVCWQSRILYIVHFSVCIIALLTQCGYALNWLIS